MTPESEAFGVKVLGLEADKAEDILRREGYTIVRSEYESKRGVEGADSERVIRARALGNNCIAITVSRFKTRI